MKRKIVQIEEDKCDGCGLCITACHEGAIQLVDGKAKLISDSYCDGLGDCLPACPTGAINIIEREAEAFDEEAVKARMQQQTAPFQAQGCPGSRAQSTNRQTQSELAQWPVQIQLVPIDAPYFNGADLLVAADCTAFAYANIHRDFMANKVTIIGCPKLDHADYASKLSEILRRNDIRSLSILKMEVPCCGGLSHAAQIALQQSGKTIPWSMTTIALDGSIKEN